MPNVTYTEDQLKAFLVKELKTLELFHRANVDSKITLKADIIKAMMDFQSEEISAAKNAEESREVVETTEEETTEEASEEAGEGTTEEESIDDSQDEESDVKAKKKPVFHRPRRKRNNMTWR